MKKFLAILMAICMMATLLCVPAFAAESADKLPAPAAGTVLRITAMKGDSIELIDDYPDFEEGWNEAMEYANDMEDYGYDRIVVDLYADWNAVGGRFTDDFFNGAGFKNDTIYFNDDVKMTLNMNGHTINGGFTAGRGRRDGEVMYIDTYADVIINNGTITGGGSFNGAGGIHINSKAKVTLNNVKVVGNTSWDDDGGGIALYNGASLVMNGGSINNNVLLHDALTCYGGAIYASESTVTLNNVEIKNNRTLDGNDLGAAIYADESTVVLDGCTVDGNGVEDAANGALAAVSIIHAVESSITIRRSTFTKNGSLYYTEYSKPNGGMDYEDVSTLIFLDESTLVMEGGNNVTQNHTGYLIESTDDSEFFVSDTTFVNNSAIVLSSTEHSNDSYFNNCTFNNNSSTYISKKYSFASHIFITVNAITFYDCNMGNSTYSKPGIIKFVNRNLDSGIVLTLSARKTDGTVETLEEYRSFETGWSTAMALSNDSDWMRTNDYDAVVVDMHADWIATNGKFNGGFFNDIGFSNDTIFIPESANVILNMNGYKIDRGISKPQDDGEVIYIMPGTKVTINDGTITGGWSTNGGGGIHISGDATVTLNDVHIKGNKVSNDDGSGIAAYDGATIIMNGGSISSNVLSEDGLFISTPYGALYLQDSSAILTDVEITNNGTYMGAFPPCGVALYIRNSFVSMKGCTVTKNGCYDESQGYRTAKSVICLDGSSSVLDVTECKFEDNGTESSPPSYLIQYESGGTVKIKDSAFNNNAAKNLIYTEKGVLEVTNSQFSANKGNIFTGVSAAGSHFTDCSFSDNVTSLTDRTFYLNEGCELAFNNCELGNSTFGHRDRATFDGKAGVGSIFGEGSLTMILARLALIASGVSIFLTVYYNKKKAVPVAANNVTEAEDEE